MLFVFGLLVVSNDCFYIHIQYRDSCEFAVNYLQLECTLELFLFLCNYYSVPVSFGVMLCCCRHMCITGFIVDIASVTGMISDLLHKQVFVLVYKFSQDHLELFFNAVRRAG